MCSPHPPTSSPRSWAVACACTLDRGSDTRRWRRRGEELGPPFRRGRGGPGGWVLLDEPELHLGGDILVPDLAGWRRERMPEVPDEPFTTVSPDWVWEVLSARTAAFDRTEKLGVYARESVRHVWFLDPDPRILEVLRLDGETVSDRPDPLG